MIYRFIIFDVDDTLLDYAASEARAVDRILRENGLPPATEEDRAHIWEISLSEWDRAGLNDTGDPYVRANYHALFRRCVAYYLDLIADHFDLALKGEALLAHFFEYLSREAVQVPHAREVCQRLSRDHVLLTATNSLCEIQDRRLKVFAPYITKGYISERVGFIKPGREIFETILREQGAAPAQCLMVGDSLGSDVAGAQGAGLAACWFNPRGEENATGIRPDYEICRLTELYALLGTAATV